MKRNTGTAQYLEDTPSEKSRTVTRSSGRSLASTLIFGLLAFVMIAVGVGPTVSAGLSNSEQVHADGLLPILCTGADGLGPNMDDQGAWQASTQMYAVTDKTSRTWTAQELFSSNLAWPLYYGEGPEEDKALMRSSGDEDRIAKAAEDGAIDQEVADSLSGNDLVPSARGRGACTFGMINNMLSNGVLGFSSVLASWTGIIATAAFDSSLICTSAEDDEGCFNLLKVIGGTGGSGDDGGVIGALTSSIYFPLLAIAVLITALWIGYIGLVKRQVREALFGALWMFVAIIIGAAFLLNPALIAKAPMTVSNSVGACIIGAFNGTNCFDNSGSGNNTSIEESTEVCKSEAAGTGLNEDMVLAVNGMSCSIWRAFVLEPYAQGAFGQSFEDLDVSSSSEEGAYAQLTDAGFSTPEETFKVNLTSSKTGDEMADSTVELDSDNNSVSNIALYQLYLMTDAKSSSDDGYDAGTSGAIDGRWYNVAAYAAQDNYTWDKWTFTAHGSASKVSLATLSLVTSVLGGAIIVLTAFIALVYYVISIVLMAIAPLFLLMAVHPGRGRSLFIGWVSQVLSNVLKYVASAFFLVIAVALYAGVLANTSNLATTFLFILILSAALFMYRGEIVNLLGRVNMGGEALSSRLSDSMKDRASRVAIRTGGAALGLAGSAVGGAAATGAGAKPSEYFKNAASGMKDNVSRELKRKSGFTGNIARQAERMSTDNRRDLRQEATTAGSDLQNARTEANTAESNYEDSRAELASTEATIASDKGRMEDFDARAEVSHNVKHEVLAGMEGDNPAFAKAQGIANQLEGLELEHRQAIATGDTSRATEIAGQKKALQSEYAEASADVTAFDKNRGDRRYNTLVRKGMENEGVSYNAADRETHYETAGRLAASEAAIEPVRERTAVAETASTQASASEAAIAARHATMNEKSIDWRPGDKMTTSQVAKTKDEADAKAWDAYRKEGGDESQFTEATGIKVTDKLKKHQEKVAKGEKKSAERAKVQSERDDRRQAEEDRRAEENAPRKPLAERKAEERRRAASESSSDEGTPKGDSGPKRGAETPRTEDSKDSGPKPQPKPKAEAADEVKVTVRNTKGSTSPSDIPDLHNDDASDDSFIEAIKNSGNDDTPKDDPDDSK